MKKKTTTTANKTTKLTHKEKYIKISAKINVYECWRWWWCQMLAHGYNVTTIQPWKSYAAMSTNETKFAANARRNSEAKKWRKSLFSTLPSCWNAQRPLKKKLNNHTEWHNIYKKKRKSNSEIMFNAYIWRFIRCTKDAKYLSTTMRRLFRFLFSWSAQILHSFYVHVANLFVHRKNSNKTTSDRDLASSFFLLAKTGVRFRNESASNFNANSSSAGANWKVLLFSFVRSLASLGWYFWAALASFERNVHVFAYV